MYKKSSGPFRDPEENELYLGDALAGVRNCKCGKIKPWHLDECDDCANKDTRGLKEDEDTSD